MGQGGSGGQSPASLGNRGVPAQPFPWAGRHTWLQSSFQRIGNRLGHLYVLLLCELQALKDQAGSPTRNKTLGRVSREPQACLLRG